MIRFDQVSFGYDGGKTIDRLSFHIAPGECTAIIGPNGAGKSTLLRLMRGLLQPAAGEITVLGKPLSSRKISALAAHMGFLFQNPDRQICKNTLSEELSFSLSAAGIPDSEREKKTAGILSAMEFSADLDPMRMSRGERQRAALASVLVTEPEILLLDEPTTGLDYRECIHIMDYIRAQNERGTTVVMVCHDMEVVLEYAKRVLVLGHGTLLADGTPADVFRRTDVLEQASLLPPQLLSLAQLCGIDAVNAEEFADVLEKEVRT